MASAETLSQMIDNLVLFNPITEHFAPKAGDEMILESSITYH